MELQTKLSKYNSIYHFRDFPNNFTFDFSPERMIFRNVALRTRDRKLYESFLQERYPNNVASELILFDKSFFDTKLLTIQETQDFFERHNVNGLQADLLITDPDTIFTAKVIKGFNTKRIVKNSENSIGTIISIDTIDNWSNAWIDVSEIKQRYNKGK